MDINLSISPAPGIINNFIVVAVYKSTAINTVVDFKSYAAPHASSRNITFTDLDPGTYYVIVWESVDGNPGGTDRHHYFYDPTYQNAEIRLDEVVVVDTTAGWVSGGTTATDATLAGWDISIERRGFGTMIDFDKDAVNADYQRTNNGTTVELKKVGDVLQPNEIFIIHFQPKLTTSSPTSQSAGTLWSGVKLITTNTSLVFGDMGKYCLIQGASTVLDITLPEASTVADGKMIAFISEGGSHLAANIKPFGTDQLKWLGDTYTNANPISICQAEELWLAFHGNSWVVMMADGAWRDVGKIVATYSKTNINMLPCNNSPFTNILYNRSYYPRLWRWMNTKLDMSLLVSNTTWNQLTGGAYPNISKFSTGNGTTTFGLPALCKLVDGNSNVIAGGYLRGVDGSGGDNNAGVNIRDGVGVFEAKIGNKQVDVPTGPNGWPSIAVLDTNSGPQSNNLPNPSQGVVFKGANPVDHSEFKETKPFSTHIYYYIQF